MRETRIRGLLPRVRVLQLQISRAEDQLGIIRHFRITPYMGEVLDAQPLLTTVQNLGITFTSPLTSTAIVFELLEL